MNTEPADLVAALYRKLLLREPDPGGLEGWTGFLCNGGSFEDFLAAVLKCDEFVDRFQGFQKAYAANCKNKFIFDYSQHGETAKLVKLLAESTLRHRMIVDVGARGRERSNSYDLMCSWGWKGLLIEANPRLISNIKKDFDGTDYIIINAAVTDQESQGTLFIGVNDDVSSITKGQAECWGAVKGTVEVPFRRLGSILEENAVPLDFDVLSVDIEGEDFKVLNDLIGNTPYRPAYVIIEHLSKFADVSDHRPIESLDEFPFSSVVMAEYSLIDQTFANLILRRNT